MPFITLRKITEVRSRSFVPVVGRLDVATCQEHQQPVARGIAWPHAGGQATITGGLRPRRQIMQCFPGERPTESSPRWLGHASPRTTRIYEDVNRCRREDLHDVSGVDRVNRQRADDGIGAGVLFHC